MKKIAEMACANLKKSGASLQREANFRHSYLIPLNCKLFWPSLAGTKYSVVKI